MKPVMNMAIAFACALTAFHANAMDASGQCKDPPQFKEELISEKQTLVLGAVKIKSYDEVFYSIQLESGKGYEFEAPVKDGKITCFRITKVFTQAKLFDSSQSGVASKAKLLDYDGQIAKSICGGRQGCDFLNDMLVDLSEKHQAEVYFQGKYKDRVNGEVYNALLTVVGRHANNMSNGLSLYTANSGMTDISGAYSQTDYMTSVSDIIAKQKAFCLAEPQNAICAGWTEKSMYEK